MKKLMKVTALLMAAAMTLTACGGKTTSTETGKDTTPAKTESQAEGQTEAAKETKKMRVAYVTAGAQGDNGFTDSVVRGMNRIKDDFGAEITVIENNNDAAKYAESMEACFQWQPDVVFADAYGFEELFAQYADQYPDVTMVNLDFVIENSNKTVSSYTFISEEGAFLAGVLAAKVTTSDLPYANPEKTVGFVGGQEITVIKGFLSGFKQGVEFVDPEIKVLVSYVGDFFDPVKCKTATKQLYAQGADIVFQAAGTSGNGALEAANEEQKYVIGVDSNQNGLYPGHVVASVIKDLDGAVYDTFSKIEDGTFEKGTVYSKGAGPSGVYLAIDEYSKEILTPEMITEINAVQDDIVDGKVTVERYTE